MNRVSTLCYGVLRRKAEYLYWEVVNVLKPLNDNVVIEVIEVEKKTASGIILTGEASTDSYEEGIVLAVGPGLGLEQGGRKEMTVQVGDRVVYTHYEGRASMERDGKKLIILNEDWILAVVEEAK